MYDTSEGVFEILPSTPILLTPNGGEQLRTSTTKTIQWSTIGVIDNIDIEYSTDNGSNWAEVEPNNIGNTGSYDWLIPYDISDQCGLTP